MAMKRRRRDNITRAQLKRMRTQPRTQRFKRRSTTNLRTGGLLGVESKFKDISVTDAEKEAIEVTHDSFFNEWFETCIEENVFVNKVQNIEFDFEASTEVSDELDTDSSDDEMEILSPTPRIDLTTDPVSMCYNYH